MTLIRFPGPCHVCGRSDDMLAAAPQDDRIAELEAENARLLAELTNIRRGHVAIVEYDLSPAMKESAIRDKLIELGWQPPGPADD